jgi:ATP-binding cassette, subfamily B, bacterial
VPRGVPVFFRLLRYAGAARGRLLGALVLALAGVALELARPWPLKFALDAMVGRGLSASLTPLAAGVPGMHTPSGRVALSVLALLVIVLGTSLVSLLVLRLVIGVAQQMVFTLSRDVFARLQRLSLAFHGRHTVGDLLQRMSQDVFVAHFAVSQVAIPGLGALLMLAGMFTIMARLDTTLTLVAGVVVPLLAGALAMFTRPMNATTSMQYEVQGRLMALLEQSLAGIRAIQGFTREPDVQRRVEASALALGQAYNRATMVQGGYKEVTAIITGLAAAATLGIGAHRVMTGVLTPGDLLVFLGYLTGLTGPVTTLATAVGAAVVVHARGARVFAILDADEEVPERVGAMPLGVVSGALTFDRVGFQYPGDPSVPDEPPDEVLTDVTFTARAGELVAIVGATGAGKTSLVSMLSRFHDPTSGRILLDGMDLRDLRLRSLREHVGLVLQDAALFPMSIAENIAFGRPSATRAAIEDAARMAQAHAFIERLPQRYETRVGERGSTLSGGERQRIALARAVLKDAPILVLDEPTSALDARTEARVFEGLRPWLRARTTLIISHRLSTVRHADRIVVLEHGRIVEDGTHDALLRANGTYADLCRHQHLAVL